MHIAETERLRLRKFITSDARFVVRLLNEVSWLTYIGDRGVKSVNDALGYIADKIWDSYSRHGYGLYCLELKDTKDPIGMCGLIKREGMTQPDIGFALLPEYEKQGFAFEAASAVIVYARNELKLTDIVAITTSDNHRSVALLKKLGLAFQNIIWMPHIDKEMMLFGFK